jgi:hypothetical protein
MPLDPSQFQVLIPLWAFWRYRIKVALGGNTLALLTTPSWV